MNNPEINELFTQWVKDNQDKIRFAAWLRKLSYEELQSIIKRLKATNQN